MQTTTTETQLTAQLADAYARCDDLLTRSGAASALDHLVSELAVCRGVKDPDDWRRALAAAREHPVHTRLRQDPYTADAFHKPRGYAGDAHTIDVVYRHRPLPAGVSPLTVELHAVTTGVPIAEAVRARCAHVAERLAVRVAEKPDAVVVSVACGHMRELHQIAADSLHAATIVAVDQDPLTLAALPRLHPAVSITAVRAAIRQLIVGGSTIPEADFVYASGLYDYLDDRAAVALTKALVARLRPGGTLLIPNLTPSNVEVGFMEAVMDWWMVYRDERAMARLGIHACGEDAGLTQVAYSLADGRVACLVVTRGQ